MGRPLAFSADSDAAAARRPGRGRSASTGEPDRHGPRRGRAGRFETQTERRRTRIAIVNPATERDSDSGPDPVQSGPDASGPGRAGPQLDTRAGSRLLWARAAPAAAGPPGRAIVPPGLRRREGASGPPACVRPRRRAPASSGQGGRRTRIWGRVGDGEAPPVPRRVAASGVR